MNISYVRLRNFKCFMDIELKLPKITLLTGENSSGKSSLLYGVLSVFQSEGFPLYLSPNGKYVDMGDFIELSFGHERNNEVSIDIEIMEPNKTKSLYRTSWICDPISKMPTLKQLYTKSNYFEINIEKNSRYNLSLSFDVDAFGKSSDYRVYHAVSDLVVKLGVSKKTVKKLGMGDLQESLKNVELIQNIQFSSLEDLRKGLNIKGGEIVKLIERQISRPVEFVGDNLNFISSFRIQPERTYYQKKRINYKVEKYGENYIDQILEWRNQGSNEYKELVRILRELKLLYLLRIRRLTGGRFEPRVAVKRGGSWSSLTDSGFGISQFLPIVVADLQLRKGSTLLVAQPEIHLHPSVQASLADYFIKNSVEKGKGYIIETHSEYILNRFRAAVAKGNIKQKDLGVYYFENEGASSVKYDVEFNRKGQIKNAPKSFFETYMMDVMDIALNA